MNRKESLTKIVFGLNGFVFLLGGSTLLGEKKILFTLVQLIAAILNIALAINFFSRKNIQKLTYLVLTMNIVVCISIGVDQLLIGENYIQFVWFFAALMSLFALIIFSLKKENKSKIMEMYI